MVGGSYNVYLHYVGCSYMGIAFYYEIQRFAYIHKITYI